MTITDQDGRTRLAELVDSAQFCMFTTTTDDGRQLSRPMAVQSVEFDGDLWFFVDDSSPKVAQLGSHPQVNLAFVDDKHHAWTSVAGTAELVHDRARMEELWSVPLEVWFPDGLDTPGIALVKVHPETVEWWEASDSGVKRVVGAVRAAVTGNPEHYPAENETAVLDRRQDVEPDPAERRRDTRSTVGTDDSKHDGDDDDVDSPTDLTPRSRKFVLRKTLSEFLDDQCTDLAAALTYYAVLALFPAVIALTSLLGLVDQGDDAVEEVLGILRDIGAGGVVDAIGPTLRDLSGSQAAGLGFVLGLVGALWSASGYVGAFGRAQNRIYEKGEGRPVWKLRPAMLALTAVLVLLVAVVLAGLVLSGPVAQSVGDAVGLGDQTVLVLSIVKWPVMLVLVMVIVALLYYFTPNVKPPKFRWVSVGAAVAIVVWVLASAAFSFYVANFSSYDKTYGALAGVIAFLLWLWITNLALLFGGELDAELERGRELQRGVAAEHDIQLPARDTRNLEKKAEKEAEQVEEAREIRRTGGEPDA